MKNLLYILLLGIFLNPLYATNNLSINKTKNNFPKSITVEYIAGDIDGNIINMLKKLYTQDILKLEQIKIKKDADICPLLKEKGLYSINCTKALSDFITKINGGKKVFNKGDIISLPILEKDTKYTSQLTRASNFIASGEKSISKKNLLSVLKDANIRIKGNDSQYIRKSGTNKSLKSSFSSRDQILISNIQKERHTYQLTEYSGETHSSFIRELDDRISMAIAEDSEIMATGEDSEIMVIGEDSQIQKANTSLYWNTLIERYSEKKNYTKLKPNIKNYDVRIQLSAYKYKDTAIITENPSDSFIKSVDESCSDWKEGDGSRSEKMHIIPISSSEDIIFDLKDEETFKIDLNMSKLCSYRQTSMYMKGKDLYEFIKNGEEQDFIFLNKSFRFRTTKNAQGNYPIAFSIWHEDKPIDEIVMNLCVGDNNTCNNSDIYTHKKANITQISNETNVSRVASLHFFGFSDKNIAALFWEHNSSAIKSWLIDKKILNDNIEVISREFDKEFPNYKNLSYKLFKSIFYDQKEIADRFFIALDVKNKNPFSYLKANENIPEVYVRSEGTKIGNLDGMPIALLPLSREYNHTKLLGLHYKIYRPLSVHETSKTCIDKHVFMYPNEGHEDKAIKIALKNRNPSFKFYYDNNNITKLRSSDDFLKWDVENKERQSLFIFLGHFGFDGRNGKLSFSNSLDNTGIMVGDFPRTSASSIAILDACGTGMQDGFNFVDGLNRRGFGSIIATNAKIEAKLGQAYLNCLVDTFSTNQNKKIGLIHTQALQCLYNIDKDGEDPTDPLNKRHRTFEADVLKYTLYGAHNVEICK